MTLQGDSLLSVVGLRRKPVCLLDFLKSSRSPMSSLISCISYHSPTPISPPYVAAGIDSAPDDGDFQGIHMYRAFRDSGRCGTAVWLHLHSLTLPSIKSLSVFAYREVVVGRYGLKHISGDCTYTYRWVQTSLKLGDNVCIELKIKINILSRCETRHYKLQPSEKLAQWVSHKVQISIYKIKKCWITKELYIIFDF